MERPSSRPGPKVRLLALLALLAGACNSASTVTAADPTEATAPPAVLAGAAATWLNDLGLNQTEPDVWRPRLKRACEEGVWDPAVAEQLAAEFIASDLSLSVRGAGGAPSAAEGARSLWLMAVQVCPDSFPTEAIEGGPPEP